jgi:predicted amidohydrolase YtcJ
MQHTLLFNGNVYDLINPVPYDWVLFSGTQIISLGHKKHRPSISKFDTKSIDLQGKTILPAFTDSHLHLVPTALKIDQLDLEPCHSPSEVMNTLSKLSKVPKGEWILGWGYNPNLWKNLEYNRQMLDSLFPHNPVALSSKDLHTLWANSLALDKAGILTKCVDIAGGHIERDDQGKPIGILKENACELVTRKYNDLPIDRLDYLLHKVAEKLYKYGITSVNAFEQMEIWKQLHLLNQLNSLPLRITCHLMQKDLDKIIDSGMVSGFGDDFLKLGGIKFFTDGSLGSQTAHLFESYVGKPQYSGISTISEEELTQKVMLAAENGLGSSIHAIGNRAINKSLNACAKAYSWIQKYRLRQRIEHAQLINPDDIFRFRDLHLIASMQPSHIADDIPVAERHWGNLSKNAYPIQPLIKKNIVVCFGSDSPVSEPNPFHGIYSAVERKYQLNPKNQGWHTEHCISVNNAVKAYTKNSAFASYNDHLNGTLSPGKRADMILIDTNIFKVPSHQILDTNVLITIMDGTIVHSADNTLD